MDMGPRIKLQERYILLSSAILQTFYHKSKVFQEGNEPSVNPIVCIISLTMVIIMPQLIFLMTHLHMMELSIGPSWGKITTQYQMTVHLSYQQTCIYTQHNQLIMRLCSSWRVPKFNARMRSKHKNNNDLDKTFRLSWLPARTFMFTLQSYIIIWTIYT